MTVPEMKAQLQLYNDAIEKILIGGQEYSLDTGATKTKVVRGDLKELQKRKDWLEAQINASEQGSLFSVDQREYGLNY